MTEPNSWNRIVREFLRDRVLPTTVSQIAREALGISYEDRGAHDLTPVAGMLRRLGWKRVQGKITRWHPLPSGAIAA